MKKKVFLISAAAALIIALFALLSLVNPSLQSEAPSWEFQKNEQGYFVSPFPMNIDADRYRILVIEMSTAAEYEDAQILWRGSYYNQFDMLKAARISLGSKDKFHKYCVNLGLSPYWTGITQQLLMIPAMNAGEFKVKFVRIEKLNPVNLLMAAWQEFTAYETIKGSTVNSIRGQRILGKEASFYVLILLTFSFIAGLGWRTFRSGFKIIELRAALNFGLYSATILSLMIWALLEARMSLDYAKTFSLDSQAYWGKTLDEKRSIISLNDFYDFTQFCNRVLPERARVDIATSNVFFSARAALYLYPHIINNDFFSVSSNPVEDFLIVYETSVDQEKYKGFELFAKYKDNKYILKRGGK